MSATKDSANTAVGRMLAILDWLASSRQPTSVSEITTQLSIPRASAYRILRSLQEWGFVVYCSQERSFQLGPRVLELGRAYYEKSNLVNVALPHLLVLRDQTGETATLNIVLRDERICIAESRSLHQLNWSWPPGSLGSLYAGAAGKVLLAFMPKDEYNKVKNAIHLKRLTASTTTNWKALEDDLTQIRRLGYWISVSEVTEGAVGMAVPVLNERKNAVAAVSLALPFARWDKACAHRYLPLLFEASRAIAQEYLGRGVEISQTETTSKALDG